jgi:hypothetical protein
MSSPIYYFLIGVEDTKAGDNDLKSEIRCRLDDYTERHCDGNNWRHPLVAVMRDGRLLTELEATKEQDERISALLRQPAANRWGYAVDMAANALAGEFVWMTDKRLTLPRNRTALSVLNRMRVRVPQILSGMYRRADPHGVPDSTRFQLAECYELLCGSEHSPFSTTWATPYSGYRCFDMRENPSKQVGANTALFLVSIHT